MEQMLNLNNQNCHFFQNNSSFNKIDLQKQLNINFTLEKASKYFLNSISSFTEKNIFEIIKINSVEFDKGIIANIFIDNLPFIYSLYKKNFKDGSNSFKSLLLHVYTTKIEISNSIFQTLSTNEKNNYMKIIFCFNIWFFIIKEINEQRQNELIQCIKWFNGLNTSFIFDYIIKIPLIYTIKEVFMNYLIIYLPDSNKIRQIENYLNSNYCQIKNNFNQNEREIEKEIKNQCKKNNKKIGNYIQGNKNENINSLNESDSKILHEFSNSMKNDPLMKICKNKPRHGINMRLSNNNISTIEDYNDNDSSFSLEHNSNNGFYGKIFTQSQAININSINNFSQVKNNEEDEIKNQRSKFRKLIQSKFYLSKSKDTNNKSKSLPSSKNKNKENIKVKNLVNDYQLLNNNDKKYKRKSTYYKKKKVKIINDDDINNKEDKNEIIAFKTKHREEDIQIEKQERLINNMNGDNCNKIIESKFKVTTSVAKNNFLELFRQSNSYNEP